MKDIWGKIEIEPDFLKIINCKEFKDLKNKSQLGLNASINATHTRYQHSIGTYYLVCKLLDICDRKFKNTLVITEEDKKALKVMALVHDIGHGCFSHVSEKLLEGTHEERTLNLLSDNNSEIHQVLMSPPFGQNILDKVLELLSMKEKIKNQSELDISNNIMLIIGKLLSGGIDVDRIDYIFRDSINVLGEENDYSDILSSINLEFVDDSIEIAFDASAEYSIANFFNKRFELYDTVYCSVLTRILECIFAKLIEARNFPLTWDTTEIEMSNYIRELEHDPDFLISRYATLLSTRSLDDGIIYKEIGDASAFEFAKSKIMNAVPELANYPNCFFLDSLSINIYNSKNKVYIKKGGLIQDIKECSRILNSDLKKEKHIFAVDLISLEYSLKKDGYGKKEIAKIIKKVQKALSPEIEQEKKYIFNSESNNPREDFKRVISELNLKDPIYIENEDTYYDDEAGTLSSMHINLRHREGEDSEWTLKRPAKDASSISKRYEKNFTTREEALEFLRTEWGIDITSVKKRLTLKTKRVKYILEMYGGTFELVFDKTTSYRGATSYPPFYMIECELKSGNSIGLYFINKILKKFTFIDECNISKKEIAESIIKEMTPKSLCLTPGEVHP